MPLIAARIFLGLFAIGSLLAICAFERRWFKLRKSEIGEGIVVDQTKESIDDREAYFPIISFGEGDQSIRFKSHYASNTEFEIGRKLPILIDSSTGQAEWYSVSNRFLPTFGFSLVFIISLALAIGIK